MAFIVDPIATALLNWLINPLERQLGYIAKVGERVAALDAAMATLHARSSDVLARTEAAEETDPTHRRASEVEEWLQGVHGINNEVDGVKANYQQRCTGDIYSNWKIGRKATKKLVRVKELYARGGTFEMVTIPRPSPTGQRIPGTSFVQGIDSNLNKVLRYLAGGSRTVGIFGMGGVGKTTLLKAINNKLSSSGAPAAAAAAASANGMRFQHVIWVVASRNADVHKLQEDIAKHLRLPLEDNADSTSRRDAIVKFLNDKRFVLLIDDVWERLDLDEAGLPDQRVVVFTTRSEEVCGQMEAHSRVKVECLNQPEAWRLFKEKVGDAIIESNAEIRRFAKEVADECKGLPLALVVVGRAMSSKYTPDEWQSTLTTLKRLQAGTNSIQLNLFPTLKYSYDNLPDDATRQCFLLCALFPEDYTMQQYPLIKYFWGHGLIDARKYRNISQVYARGHELIGVLTSACLLEFNHGKGKLKMHDILRDMALWIACDDGEQVTKWIVRAGLWSSEPLRGVNDWDMAERVSLMKNKMAVLPVPRRGCENLTTLMLQENPSLERIPKDFFRYFPALSYLNLSWTRITEVPEEVSRLVELQYLNLGSTMIRSLSIELSRLTKLRQLRLFSCKNLSYIPYGLLSNLPVLQVLDLYGSRYIFRSHDAKENLVEEEGCSDDDDDDHKEEENSKERGKQVLMGDLSVRPKTNIKELESLKGRISALGVNLEIETILDLQSFVDITSIWSMELIGLRDSQSSHLLSTLLEAGNSIEFLKLSNFPNLEELELTSEKSCSSSGWCFRKLTRLNLRKFDKLSKISWEGVMLLETFPRLKTVVITKCHGLREVTWAGQLSCLEILYINNCDGLEEIISVKNEEEHPSPSKNFPNLQFLELRDLRNLRRRL